MANEKRLIDANTLSEELSTLTMTITGLRAGKGVLREFMAEYRNGVLRIVDEQPTVDAVKVVRGQWIPVTDRLPEECDRYLCNVRSFAFPGSFYQAILHYDKYGFREGNIYTDDVTHWMPLPEPPETAG